MSGCPSCGASTSRRNCRECTLSERATERAEEPESLPDCPSCGGDTSGEGVTCYKCRGDRIETDGGRVRFEEPVYHVVCHGCEYEDVIDGDRIGRRRRAGLEAGERSSRESGFGGSDANAAQIGLRNPLRVLPLSWRENNAARKMRAATAETAEAGRIIA